MINRRHALKTIAGATVVGSLSGCVQLATQQTTHFHGTPWIVQSETRGGLAGTASNDGYLATAVGVEAHSTVERFGVTREIVAHSWGVVYGSWWQDGIAPGQYSIATFTTPSITVAGRELNPIKDLTVGEIGGEFASIVHPESETLVSTQVSRQVNDATGKKVLRAFRDSVRSPGAEYQPPSLDASASGGTLSTVPDWDGEVHEFNISIPDEEAESISGVLRFDKHDGEFGVVFGAGGGSITQVLESVSTAKIVQKTAPWTVRPDPPQASEPTIIHPANDQFSVAQLGLHLLDTNVHGLQGMVTRARKLIDETQDLLAKASNKSRNEENETFQVVSNTQEDLKQLDTIMGGLGEDLQAVKVTSSSGDVSNLVTARKKSEKAANIAARAHERVASNNDTRDEEDDRFVAIERNLASLKEMTATADNLLKKSGKLVENTGGGRKAANVEINVSVRDSES